MKATQKGAPLPPMAIARGSPARPWADEHERALGRASASVPPSRDHTRVRRRSAARAGALRALTTRVRVAVATASRPSGDQSAVLPGTVKSRWPPTSATATPARTPGQAIRRPSGESAGAAPQVASRRLTAPDRTETTGVYRRQAG